MVSRRGTVGVTVSAAAVVVVGADVEIDVAISCCGTRLALSNGTLDTDTPRGAEGFSDGCARGAGNFHVVRRIRRDQFSAARRPTFLEVRLPCS